ncbi:MAG: SDR family oxidoreductase [Desulfitobacterium hafniense]|nr:SDR family oxidoreductase [Desulfitobacterium hafniense]
MLKGKTALITGGGTGIGRSIALLLASHGVNIAINYSRSEKDASETKEEVLSKNVKSQIYKANVGTDSEVRQMMSDVIRDFGSLDILVNNAGVTHFVEHADLEGLKEEYWDNIMNVNVKGLFFCCRAAADELKKNNGCIVNITSIAGLTGLGSSIAYSASKAAAISVTKSLARVMAPQVRVNSIAPGVVETRWVDGQKDHIKRLAAGTPLGRVAGPDDVAEVAYALIANANFVTGQTIVVDGGAFI